MQLSAQAVLGSRLEVAVGVGEERARALEEVCAGANKRATAALASLNQALPMWVDLGCGTGPAHRFGSAAIEKGIRQLVLCRVRAHAHAHTSTHTYGDRQQQTEHVHVLAALPSFSRTSHCTCTPARRLEQQTAEARDVGDRAAAAAASSIASVADAKQTAATALATVQGLERQQAAAAASGGAPQVHAAYVV
eukprot:1158447-Pelagomonas_calceolata.AAC.8